MADLSMPERLEPIRRDGTPVRTHDRDLTDAYSRELHFDHRASICDDCGCCWCCQNDCCLSREYPCLNEECGCRMEYLAVKKANAGGVIT